MQVLHILYVINKQVISQSCPRNKIDLTHLDKFSRSSVKLKFLHTSLNDNYMLGIPQI